MLAYSGVRAMRRNRNQADIAMTLAPRLMVRADDAQTGVLSCRTGVRLERARMEAGDLAQIVLEFLSSCENDCRYDSHKRLTVISFK